MSLSKDIPRSKDINLFGLVKLMRSDIISFSADQFSKFGSTYRQKIFKEDLIISKDPDWIKHILVTNQKNYKKNKTFEALEMALGQGLFTSSGAIWKRQRQMVQPAFHKKRLAKLIGIMVGVINEKITEWHQLKPNSIFALDQHMSDISSELVVNTLLGNDFTKGQTAIADKIHAMQSLLIKLVRFPSYIHVAKLNGELRKFNSIKAEFDDAVYAIIAKRKKSKQISDDLLGMLMAAEYEDGTKMTGQQLRDEFITIFVAGHETTSQALTWAFYLLSQSPNAYKKLKEEAQQFDFKTEKITIDHWRKMTYATAVIKESMRLYPPAYAIGRDSIKDDVIGGVSIKANQTFALSLFDLHRDAAIWDDALLFKPERFLGDKISDNERRHYFPFGAGPRMCIGNNFAMMEATFILLAFFKDIDYSLVDKQRIEPSPVITLKPKYGIKIRLK